MRDYGTISPQFWVWYRRHYVMDTGEHRTTHLREPFDADIRRHRKKAAG